MHGPDPQIDEIINMKQQLRGLFIEHWLTKEVFTWVWWIGIATLVIPFIIWLIVVDKKRMLEICVFGLIVNVSSIFLDVVGSEFVLWEYPVHILPQLPLLFPVDLVILPVVYMIVYQKYSKWWPYLITSAIAAAVLAFCFEPLAVLAGQYKLIIWKYYFSFPIYIMVAAFSKLVVQGLLAVQKKHA
jgi:hypothetical protein